MTVLLNLPFSKKNKGFGGGNEWNQLLDIKPLDGCFPLNGWHFGFVPLTGACYSRYSEWCSQTMDWLAVWDFICWNFIQLAQLANISFSCSGFYYFLELFLHLLAVSTVGHKQSLLMWVVRTLSRCLACCPCRYYAFLPQSAPARLPHLIFVNLVATAHWNCDTSMKW